MAITFVQSASTDVSPAGVNTPLAFTVDNVGGNCLVVDYGCFFPLNYSPPYFSPPTISDSQGNVWVKVVYTVLPIPS